MDSLEEKRLFCMKKFEIQEYNFINKSYSSPKFFSYHFEPNFKKWCDSNKSRIIFSAKRFSTTRRFQFLKINSLMAKIIEKQYSKTKFL